MKGRQSTALFSFLDLTLVVADHHTLLTFIEQLFSTTVVIIRGQAFII
jgi:hypothetical protein